MSNRRPRYGNLNRISGKKRIMLIVIAIAVLLIAVFAIFIGTMLFNLNADKNNAGKDNTQISENERVSLEINNNFANSDNESNTNSSSNINASTESTNSESNNPESTNPENTNQDITITDKDKDKDTEGLASDSSELKESDSSVSENADGYLISSINSNVWKSDYLKYIDNNYSDDKDNILVAVADIDKDGIPELLINNNTSALWGYSYNNGNPYTMNFVNEDADTGKMFTDSKGLVLIKDTKAGTMCDRFLLRDGTVIHSDSEEIAEYNVTTKEELDPPHIIYTNYENLDGYEILYSEDVELEIPEQECNITWMNYKEFVKYAKE